ncbi:FAD-dependent monooxygenase [Paraferrimonas sedimenticola]|uniref:FAD-dependent 2-octaprenylphenol hydroxylase n=1 Tax=Paraferrimonas sedimenticola TaxID=375674 RepID=A0AA37VYJ7_9GAMM|nr:FAD-dependent monooxygenase [Paraferrimonas sedimenticola]GLP95515.1 FAD-dependent 2-octaprenylphenol hydroxylase [Paraferrimonas sedimenticola]
MNQPMQAPINVDIAVIGGGMVGMACAVGAAQQGYSVAILAPETVPPMSDDYGLRVSAISHASQRLLTRLGAWNNIPRKAPYQSMHVWDKDGLGRIDLTGDNLGHKTIGHIIENHAVQLGLQSALEASDKIQVVSDKLAQLTLGDDSAWAMTEGGRMVGAKLVVGADGARSKVRQLANIGIKFQDYGHNALVASIKTELPHDGVARQVFLKDGPLAFLPLGEPNLCSIVWSLPPQEASRLSQCSNDEFNRELTAAFDGALGLCELVSERPAFPLTMRLANDFAKQRLVLMGDAAHTIHPLAGQGVNLGLLDCGSLLDKLEDWQGRGVDIGDERYLAEYQRWRKAEALEMIATMEAFKRLFAGNHPLKQGIRGLGMKLVDNLPMLKDKLVARAMGLSGDLPTCCR